MKLLDLLIREAQDDALRPWCRRSTGGLLVGVVLLAISGQVLLALLLE